MDEQAWVERTAGQLALTLADPSVRAELLTLLAGTKDERERQRRLEAAAANWQPWKSLGRYWRTGLIDPSVIFAVIKDIHSCRTRRPRCSRTRMLGSSNP
jgi:hypothetical protein